MNLAYIAGFFDGEGCIGFSRTRTYTYPRVLVTNTNLDILEELRDKFGGDIKPLTLRKANWKQGYYWRLQHRAAVEFLSSIKPWLRLKAPQAELVFAWDAIRIGSGTKTTVARAEHADALELLVAQMHWLNKKGENLAVSPINSYLETLNGS